MAFATNKANLGVPSAPAGFSLEKEFPGVYWHQRWQLFQGVFTPGRNDIAMMADHCGLPRDLRGLRVLDIGAWNGCMSFECERRGAAEVVALTTEAEIHSGFSRLARAVGSRVVRNQSGTVYHMDPRELGAFDLVLFFGVLYHLRYPLLAIDNIRNVCRGTVLIETHAIDHGWLEGRQPGSPMLPLSSVHPNLPEMAVWRYYHDGELCADRSNFFGPSCQAVIDGFTSAGFKCKLLHRWGDRASFEAVAGLGLAEALKDAYEMHASGNLQFFQFAPQSPVPISAPPRAELGVPHLALSGSTTAPAIGPVGEERRRRSPWDLVARGILKYARFGNRSRCREN
jgi:tRNA (mo5U34)-methyltransferase